MKRRPLFWFLLIVLLTIPNAVEAQQRKLLYPKTLAGDIGKFAKNIQDPHRQQIAVGELPPASRYFVRILPRKYVLDEHNNILGSAVLAQATKPFAFLTTPESVYGRSLLDIYADIGYEAEGIVTAQRDLDVVAVLFRYPDNVTLSTVMDGRFGGEWPNGIYSTSWDNIIAVFTRLVQADTSAACKEAAALAGKKDPDPVHYICLPPSDQTFVAGFPASGQQEVKDRTYIQLKAAGGDNWKYRELLENKLSVFEHFRGDGRTENELIDLKGGNPPRLREVVGPNVKLKALPEVAVIDLGRLIIGDCYSDGGKELPKCKER